MYCGGLGTSGRCALSYPVTAFTGRLRLTLMQAYRFNNVDHGTYMNHIVTCSSRVGTCLSGEW
jgi:hypothetical protein